MKARVKFNNEIIDVLQVGTKTHLYDIENIEFLDNPQDYWEKLKHQYAGMAMQAYMIAAHISHFSFCENDMKDCVSMATALVEKLKNE